MESLTLNISTLNDFIFCPYSIYLHNVYGALDSDQYHQEVQVAGRNAHAAIDEGTHDTRQDILLGMSVYSEKYGLSGKIDLFDIRQNKLVERKKRIVKIYDGYVYQLYGQYFCLIEMGYEVENLSFHSLVDNRNYPIVIPDVDKTKDFENYLNVIRNYDPQSSLENINPEKCKYCIYQPLCDQCEHN